MIKVVCANMDHKSAYISFDSHSNMESRCISSYPSYPSPTASASRRIQFFAHAQLSTALRLNSARL